MATRVAPQIAQRVAITGLRSQQWFCRTTLLRRPAICSVSAEIKNIADRDETARRLMTIPGVGPLGATAILAFIGDPARFRKARDVAAWLGLVPRQHSTVGKQTLHGIAKRGSRYLRTLLIHGARSVLMHLDRTKDRLGQLGRRQFFTDGLKCNLSLELRRIAFPLRHMWSFLRQALQLSNWSEILRPPLIPALRQIYATGVPCSPCFRTKAFCTSVNFDAFM